MEHVAWGIIGPGTIAERFATELHASRTGRLAAVASRDASRAEEFGERFGDGTAPVRGYGSVAELLADPGVDAVYIATPHTEHVRLVIEAAEAGKHIVSEKPLSVNRAGAMLAIEATRRAGVYLAEAFMYRFHPQTAKLVELVSSGAVGEVEHIEASFAFAADLPAEHRLMNPELAGGGILDVGGYPVSIARLVAGAAVGAPFADPTEVTGNGTIGSTGVDEWASASLVFPSGITAHVTSGVRMQDDNRVVVTGSTGQIIVSDPWLPSVEDGSTIEVRTISGTESIHIPGAPQYAIQADAVAAFAEAGQAPQMRWADSLGNAATLDRWREAVGLEYPFESIDTDIPTGSGRPLAVRAELPMPTGRIAGIDHDISRLVMGVDNQQTLSHASAMFDDFFERGGNAFDTAWLYGDGLQEQLLGRWLVNRGLRDDVVVIGKGAHTPFCDPESISRQLFESLDRLGTDHLDLYLMHRDNVEVPVGEFVDVLNEHAEAGRIRAFGGSNWSIERFEAANAYAAANGKRGFAALSNHFGLARALDVPWAGCVEVTDPTSRAWLEETKTPLLPWSSQARGFFTGRAEPEDLSDPDLVRCYYSDDNFERLARARQLGTELGVAPTAIALAYVLAQDFPTFALIGPRSIEETRSSTDALSLKLTPEQVAWLDLRV
ncbi:aldo/keto reductase [uncultured Plantibacter sp.]|uniref:aldo/keto reductase n=1 Tax=uncultured Plantibacter sp. TaxID=293337 RepID=UPI0028D5D2ED|nr:aldo/keto reductase [uncultured Plantibacter sp.]